MRWYFDAHLRPRAPRARLRLAAAATSPPSRAARRAHRGGALRPRRGARGRRSRARGRRSAWDAAHRAARRAATRPPSSRSSARTASRSPPACRSAPTARAGLVAHRAPMPPGVAARSPACACLTAHDARPRLQWQRNFQVRGDLVEADGGWALRAAQARRRVRAARRPSSRSCARTSSKVRRYRKIAKAELAKRKAQRMSLTVAVTGPDRRDRQAVHPRARAPARRRRASSAWRGARSTRRRTAGARPSTARATCSTAPPSTRSCAERRRRRPPRVHHRRRLRARASDINLEGSRNVFEAAVAAQAPSGSSTPRRSPPTASTRTTRSRSPRTSRRAAPRRIHYSAPEGRASRTCSARSLEDSRRPTPTSSGRASSPGPRRRC